MRAYIYQTIAWTPRILALFIAFFLSMFATESLNSNGPLLGRFFELCLQLFPALIVLGLSIFAWRNPGYGAYFFFILGIIFYLYFDHVSIVDYVFISGPLFFTAFFFLLSKALSDKQSIVNSK